MVTATSPRVPTPPVVWQFALSHYVEKVRWALDLKRVPHVRRSFLPGLHINRIKKMTGQTAVLVVEFNGASVLSRCGGTFRFLDNSLSLH
jgi:glutathione S-transferase